MERASFFVHFTGLCHSMEYIFSEEVMLLSAQRHYFPGNNTPQGFFSYYRYILSQREASRIICIKGGPGTGKSTFMKKIGERFAEMGEDVDFLHCSADEDSLDGVVLKNHRIALIDGTSPHMTDPVTPGAVDKIVNLGEFWNEEGIVSNKVEIIDLNEETSRWYRVAYNYLSAARSVLRSLEEVYNEAVRSGEVYRLVADIVAREYAEYPISMGPGRQKKFFASAITAGGMTHYIDTLVEGVDKVYIVSSPEGFQNSSFMEILREGAVYRGFDTEVFYCPMAPDEKIEHLIIPELSLAFITVNAYHDIEPWEVIRDDDSHQEITLIDMSDYMDSVKLEESVELTESLKDEFDILLGKAIKALGLAKETHMKVEAMYVPNMNFTQVSALADEIFEELKGK